jgi:hypothetical protein
MDNCLLRVDGLPDFARCELGAGETRRSFSTGIYRGSTATDDGIITDMLLGSKQLGCSRIAIPETHACWLGACIALIDRALPPRFWM